LSWVQSEGRRREVEIDRVRGETAKEKERERYNVCRSFYRVPRRPGYGHFLFTVFPLTALKLALSCPT